MTVKIMQLPFLQTQICNLTKAQVYRLPSFHFTWTSISEDPLEVPGDEHIGKNAGKFGIPLEALQKGPH